MPGHSRHNARPVIVTGLTAALLILASAVDAQAGGIGSKQQEIVGEDGVKQGGVIGEDGVKQGGVIGEEGVKQGGII